MFDETVSLNINRIEEQSVECCIFNCIFFCKVNVLNDVLQVITGVMNMLNMKIPPFVRIDLLQIILTQALSLGK